MGEQPAFDEMRIAHSLLQRHYDSRAAVGFREDWPPFLRRARGNALRHGLTRLVGRAHIVDEFRAQPDRLAEGEPEFLFDRSAADQLAVLGGVDAVARRAADQRELSRLGELTGRRTQR